MKKKQIFLLIAAIVIALVLWITWPTEEKKVARTIDKAVEGVEKEKILLVMSQFSRKYKDSFKNNYESMAGFLSSHFSDVEDLTFSTLSKRIEIIDEETAEALVETRLTATHEGETGYLLGTTLEPASALLRFRKEQGKWKIVEISNVHLPN